MRLLGQLIGLCAIGVLVASCTSAAGSSFETLGVPEVSPPQGRSAVIVGWGTEEREGWSIAKLRVEGRHRDEWNQSTQRPAVIYLSPGTHAFQIFAEQRSLKSGNVIKRFRSTPVEASMTEAGSTLCVVRVGGKRRRRPRLKCSTATEPQESRGLVRSPYPDSKVVAESPVNASKTPPMKLVKTPYASQGDGEEPARPGLMKNPYDDIEVELTERVRMLEERLERIERSLSQPSAEDSIH